MLAATSVTFSSAMIAFGFSYFRFPGRQALFYSVLATMMLPGAVTFIPQFLIWDRLGFNNTLYPLWVPATCSARPSTSSCSDSSS